MKRQREIPEYGAFARRMIRAYGRRVADADPEDLAGLRDLRDDVERAIQVAVDGQRRDYGRSWAEIGRGLGITRQSAQERYGRSEAPGGALADAQAAPASTVEGEAARALGDRGAALGHVEREASTEALAS